VKINVYYCLQLYVVLKLKYTSTLTSVISKYFRSHFFCLWEAKHETKCTQLVQKEYGIKYSVCKTHTALPVIQFSQNDPPSTLQLFLIFCGTVSEVLTVMRLIKQSGFIFTGSIFEQQTSVSTSQITQSHNLEDYNFEVPMIFSAFPKKWVGVIKGMVLYEAA